MRKTLLLLVLSGCFVDDTLDKLEDVVGQNIGEGMRCTTVGPFDCGDVEPVEVRSKECTTDKKVLFNELAFNCREEAIANGCPDTAFCSVTECEGTGLVCF